MQRRSAVVTAFVAVACLLTAAAAVAAGSHPSWPHSRDYFTVSGTVAGLYPGAHKSLRLTVTKTRKDKVILTRLLVSVVSVNRSGCPKSSVWSPGFSGRRHLYNKHAIRLNVPIFMKSTAPEACQGATFSLRYSGTGVRR